ncbi:T-lymphoma invasion and metastasis-inducing protein 1-like isoform X3 [Scleropages formosus]|uniref:T-lymphoma invasion and metastasis-inducing protein 1-like isoform X3 n=1 Tax=Scleropages formosus TaxID=113540 RepID=UPI0010FAAA8A|nr:T-lymphoma invasion and metastasis-inducing protein 1-like isoform X3 [Scleropages formosus]
MGNVESQNWDRVFCADDPGLWSRKHVSHSLRVSGKRARRSRHASTGKTEHRNSETSTRSSSTPSIPQSLADNGLEPFIEAGTLRDFGSPIWVDRVAMSLRPVSFHDGPAESSQVPISGSIPNPPGEHSTYMEKVCDGPRESVAYKKKRSKSADTWREDSLEFSLSDISQDNLTSTEEIGDITGERGSTSHCDEPELLDSSDRSNSMDELYIRRSPSHRSQNPAHRSPWNCFNKHSQKICEDNCMVPFEDDRSAFGAYTLPCRRSHCLSEGLPGHQGELCTSLQGRRVLTTQDITTGDDSEHGDSGIDGVSAEAEQRPRRYKAMSASFSVCSPTGQGLFATGSDSGGSGEGGGGDVYENFRLELERSSCHVAEPPDEVCSAASDDCSSGTGGSAYPLDPPLDTGQGTVRKAGTLTVKNFLVHKKNKKVEPAPRRKWKHYWVSLKGCTLFFYETDGRFGIDHNSVPKHAVWVENSIVQAVPEHPKKNFVFCLSNSQGDAFLFQTSSQTELENWITAIHSACASAVARQHRRDDTVRLLRSEIRKLEQKIDMDEKMKKMGEMQLSTVTNGKKRKTILEQIFLWEQNLEQFHVDLFRFRCYLASLQGGELPNPKRLLAVAARPTKLAMGRLGIFSVSSFHALVVARMENGVRQRTQAMSRTSTKRKSRFSSLWGLDTASKKKTKGRPSISQVFADGREPTKKCPDGVFVDTARECVKENERPVKSIHKSNTESDVWVPHYLTPSWVCLPNDKPVLAIVQPGDSTLDVLESICKTHHLDPARHYMRLKFLTDDQVQFYVPKPEEEVSDLVYKEIQICSRITKLIKFDRHESCTAGYGFSISVVQENDRQKVYITDVKVGGLAFARGLNAGDEVLQVNGKDTSCLSVSDMKAAFPHPSLSLTVSTLPTLDRTQLCYFPPQQSDGLRDLYTDIFSQSQEDILDDGMVMGLESSGDSLDGDSEIFSDPEENRKSTEQVAAFCRSLHDMNPSEGSSSTSPDSPLPPPATPRQLSDADRLRKVICELVETERTYVKDLNCLIEKYLTPLQQESFLTQDELDVLFGNLPEMVEFQVEFLKTLEDGTRLVPDLEKLEKVDQFKKVLFSLGGSFLYYADRFKIYSAFCASHTKVPKVLVKAKTDPDFKAFLDTRNPKQQHSSTLESYLIKPIQRVLKYPLLLRELYSLTDPDSEEHYHLDVAMKAMNKVASHINEMQKIHEEYGAVFDQLIAEQAADKKEVTDLSMGDLLLHTNVSWINPPPFLGKWKKDPELATFVFRNAVVFVYKECSKQKKKIGGSHRGSTSDEKDPFRFRYMIATDALQVRSLPSAYGEGTAACEIVHVKSESEGRPERTFHLCCRSAESKKDLLKMVHSILRDKQRRLLLKTESLPLSQQYVPFGGKRLCALKGARPAMNRAVSAPTRNLGRRKLVRNRFTIDTDTVFDSGLDRDMATENTTPDELTHADTDRWVEEQFNLDRYDQEQEEEEVKETDILSDEDEDCASNRSASIEPGLEIPVRALSLDSKEENMREGEDETEREDIQVGNKTGVNDLTLESMQLRKTPEGSEGLVSPRQGTQFGGASEEVIWVRRDDFERTGNI